MTDEIGRTIRDNEVRTGMHMDTGTVIIITDVTPEPTQAEFEAKKCIGPVSYTHLDVYKRQIYPEFFIR